MRQSIKVTALVMALGTAASARAQEGSAQSCNRLSATEHVVALNEIQNLMGRYAHLGTLRGESTLAELFAMSTAGTSWKTPYGPDGLDPMKKRFERPAEEDPGKIAGQLIMHAMLTPVIEIAGDGKTPPRGPKIPQPYCTFDPQDAY